MPRQLRGARLRPVPGDAEERAVLVDLARRFVAGGPSSLSTLSEGEQDRLGAIDPAVVDYHRMTGVVAAALGDDARRAPTMRDHLRVLADLDVLRQAIDATGCRWAVLKGPALAERRYGDPSLRPYLDLDVLVSPRDLGTVLGALCDAGSVLVPADFRAMAAESWGEIPVVLPFGTMLDLHWGIFCRPQQRAAYALDVETMLDRAPRVAIGGAQIPVLEPADEVRHLCGHAVFSGADRIGWWLDVALATADPSLDWATLSRRAAREQVAGACAVVLEVAAAALGADVPSWTLAALGRDRRWVRVARGGIAPPWRAERYARMLGISGRVVVTATRDRLLSSVVELGRLIVVRRLAPKVPPTKLPVDGLEPLDGFDEWLATAAREADG